MYVLYNIYYDCLHSLLRCCVALARACATGGQTPCSHGDDMAPRSWGWLCPSSSRRRRSRLPWWRSSTASRCPSRRLPILCSWASICTRQRTWTVQRRLRRGCGMAARSTCRRRPQGPRRRTSRGRRRRGPSYAKWRHRRSTSWYSTPIRSTTSRCSWLLLLRRIRCLRRRLLVVVDRRPRRHRRLRRRHRPRILGGCPGIRRAPTCGRASQRRASASMRSGPTRRPMSRFGACTPRTGPRHTVRSSASRAAARPGSGACVSTVRLHSRTHSHSTWARRAHAEPQRGPPFMCGDRRRLDAGPLSWGGKPHPGPAGMRPPCIPYIRTVQDMRLPAKNTLSWVTPRRRSHPDLTTTPYVRTAFSTYTARGGELAHSGSQPSGHVT